MTQDPIASIAASIATFELWQNGEMVAGVSAPREVALTEITHYAMVYGQDGPVEIREISERQKP